MRSSSLQRGAVDHPEAADLLRAGLERRRERVTAEVELGQLGDVGGGDGGRRQQHHAVDVRQQVGERQPRGGLPQVADRQPREDHLGEPRPEPLLDPAAAVPEEPHVQRAGGVVEQRGEQDREVRGVALARHDRAVDLLAVARGGGALDRERLHGLERLCGLCGRRPLLRAPLGGGDVGRGQLAPQRVHLVLRAAGEDRAEDLLELAIDVLAHGREGVVVEARQAVEADVGEVLRPEVDLGADRADRQVAVQSRGDHRAVLAAVGLQQLERALDVGHERALAHGEVAVLVRHRILGRVAGVDVGERRVARWWLAVGEHGVDRRGQTAGEERGDVEREQQLDGVPVAAADRAVAAQVLDRLGREQAALVAVEGDEDRPQVAVQREAVADAEQRVHVPAEAQRPRVLGDRLVHRGVAVDGDDVELALDVVEPALGPRASAQALEQGGELVAGVQADALVADQVAERGDALDVVADVRRGAVGARVAVVDHREGATAGGGRGR